MNRKTNVRNGIIMGLVNNALTIILPFVSRTIIIRQLGIEYVGLGGLFTSILQVLSLSELGFGGAVSAFLYKPIADNDTEKIKAILNFIRKIYRMVGLAILLFSVALLPFLDGLIAGSVPEELNIYVLYMLYVANTVISYFTYAYKRILLSANQRYDIDVSITSVCIIGQYVIQIILLLLYKNYYMYVVIIPLMTATANILAYIITTKLYPKYYCEGELEKSDVERIFKNSGGAFCSQIGSTVYLSVDNIVISAYLGLMILGKYNNYYYVIASLIAIFAVIHNSIRPTIGNIIATEGYVKIWDYFVEINQIYMMLAIVCCSCCVVLFQDFESIWAGKDNMLDFGIVILITSMFFVGRLGGVLSIFKESAGLLWEGKFIPLISAGVNLSLNIFLVNMIGLPGIIISTIVGSLTVGLPGNVYITFKYLFKDKGLKKLFFEEMIRLCIQYGVVSVSCHLLFIKWHVQSWAFLVLKGIVTAIVAMIMVMILNFNHSGMRLLFKTMRERIAGSKL